MLCLKIWQDSQKHLCHCARRTDQTLVQVFFSEFRKISKNTFYYRTRMVTVSEIKTEVLQSNLFETPSEMVKLWKQPTVVLFKTGVLI